MTQAKDKKIAPPKARGGGGHSAMRNKKGGDQLDRHGARRKKIRLRLRNQNIKTSYVVLYVRRNKTERLCEHGLRIRARKSFRSLKKTYFVYRRSGCPQKKYGILCLPHLE